MSVILKVVQGLLGIWTIVQSLIAIFKKNPTVQEQEKQNEQNKQDIENKIQNNDIDELNKDAGWNK
jgi:hypothetical protein